MSSKPWYDRSNEDQTPPAVASDVLQVRKAKAEAIKAVERQQAAERKSKFEVGKGEETRVINWAQEHIKWRGNFRKYRKQQKAFSQWDTRERFPVKVFGGRKDCKATASFDLANYYELNIDTSNESYKFFDRFWSKYDCNGFGKLSYKDFESLLTDIGFEFGRPSWKQVDPLRTQQVTFRSAVEWWSRSLERAERHQGQSVDNSKRKSAKRVKESRFIVEGKNDVQLLSDPQVRRARKNARTKQAGKSSKFREFRKTNRGAKNERTIATYYLKDGKTKQKKTTDFDLTNYKPVKIDVSAQQQITVNLIWRKYDTQGLGSLDYEEFEKLLKDKNLSGETPFAKKGEKVKFEDFLQWWFADNAEEEEKSSEQPKRPQSPTGREISQANKLLERKGRVAKAKAELKAKYASRAAEFRKYRKTPKKKKQEPWKVEIHTTKDGKSNKYDYNLANYAPAFIPAGKEMQLQQLDLIWKKYDKEGTGTCDVDRFQTILSKLGSELNDEKILTKLQDENGKITFENFSTLWFSKTRDIIPMAPPAPQEKKQKVDTIRASVDHITRKIQQKYKLAPDNEWAEMRHNAQAEARKKSDAFKKYRMANSPTKKKGGFAPVRKNSFDIELRYKDPSLEIQGIGLSY